MYNDRQRCGEQLAIRLQASASTFRTSVKIGSFRAKRALLTTARIGHPGSAALAFVGAIACPASKTALQNGPEGGNRTGAWARCK